MRQNASLPLSNAKGYHTTNCRYNRTLLHRTQNRISTTTVSNSFRSLRIASNAFVSTQPRMSHTHSSRSRCMRRDCSRPCRCPYLRPCCRLRCVAMHRSLRTVVCLTRSAVVPALRRWTVEQAARAISRKHVVCSFGVLRWDGWVGGGWMGWVRERVCMPMFVVRRRVCGGCFLYRISILHTRTCAVGLMYHVSTFHPDDCRELSSWYDGPSRCS